MNELTLSTTILLANGFLPTRASWMLDFVAIAMLGVFVVLTYSIYLIRYRKKAELHRNIQITTAIVLTLALVAFEIDVRFITNWRELAASSPFFESGVVGWWLFTHLIFAIPTPIIWAVVILSALKKFKNGFEASDPSFNKVHRISGWVAASFMYMTAATGLIFYYLAFVA
ncbi:MAG: DUF420 domain-containing protein [Mariniblastus sp.]